MVRPFKVFTHLLDAEGNIWAQHDAHPGGGCCPANTWVEDEVIMAGEDDEFLVAEDDDFGADEDDDFAVDGLQISLRRPNNPSEKCNS